MELLFLFLLILLMIMALSSGFPVAFSLPGAAIVTVFIASLCGYLFADDVGAFFAQGGPDTWLTSGVTNFRGIFWQVERDTLIAIPLFIFMGIMLQRSQVAEDLLVTMAQLFGPIPGGLGISVILVGALLAATTGIVGATVVAMGLISLPPMLRNKYSQPLATGAICASGTLGQIIPPSIVLIILADQLASAADQASSARKALYKITTGEFNMPSVFDITSTSAGEMFLGAFFPGLVLVGLYVLYIGGFALIKPKSAPAVPYHGKYDRKFAFQVFLALIPPLLLIFAVLGSIIMGIATVNAAGSVGAAGATIMAGYRLNGGRRRTYWPVIIATISIIVLVIVSSIHPITIKKISWVNDWFWFLLAFLGTIGLVLSLIWSGYRVYKIDNTLQSIMIETAKTTSMVFLILLGAAMLTSAFRGFGGEELVKEALTSLPGGFWGQFIAVMLVIFLLGFFLDFIEIAVVVVPIVAPILLMQPDANVTAVWLGVMIGLNIQTSFLTPPFGFALFYLRGVASKAVKTLSIYKGVIAFIILQLVALVIVAYNPRLVNYLPKRMLLTSATAPPPINPALQPCLEDYVFPVIKSMEPDITDNLANVKHLDFSILPKELKTELIESFDKIENTYVLINNVVAVQEKINSKSDQYRELHIQVRQIQADVRRLNNKIDELKEERDRSNNENQSVFAEKINILKAEKSAVEANIPSNWQKDNTDFSNLLKTEKTARNKYQRNVDGAYEPLRETIQQIAAYDSLSNYIKEIKNLKEKINNDNLLTSGSEIESQVNQLTKEIGSIAGADKIRSALYNVRKSLQSSNYDKTKLLIDEVTQIFEEELEWRKNAYQTILSPLQTLEQQLRHNIGLRLQPKIPKDIALRLAGCTAKHRDLSLQF